ncbi:hypothetical protein HLI_05320 [Halobacillus litoralis]|uniref:Uncharacterized protein n=1 Tax=Halobacillus litoralis TaxID=45668 RepID=A0A410MAE1_9BACI|nr:hypothetical protein HLI_05320 [Halobacillus litoralis]
MTPAGTARAEDPLGQVIFLTKLAEAVPAASIHRQAIREKQQQALKTPSGLRRVFQWPRRSKVRGGSARPMEREPFPAAPKLIEVSKLSLTQ